MEFLQPIRHPLGTISDRSFHVNKQKLRRQRPRKDAQQQLQTKTNAKNVSSRSQKTVTDAASRIKVKVTVKVIDLDDALVSEDHTLRRSRRLSNQKIEKRRKITIQQNNTSLEETDLTVLVANDPLARLKNCSEFVMYGDLGSQTLFMACLGMRRVDDGSVVSKSGCISSSFCNNTVNKVSLNSSVTTTDIKLPESGITSSVEVPANRPNLSNSSACSKTFKDSSSKLSLYNLLEEVYLIYPHDLVDHDDSDEQEKLDKEHAWRLEEITRDFTFSDQLDR